MTCRTTRIAVALCALVAVSCSRSAPDDGSGQKVPSTATGQTELKRLVIGLQQEPDKLNSALNAMVYGTYINQAIYGYFVKYNEKMELIPEVITEIPSVENGGISADGLTYTYHLRAGIKWHDGVPFTAADVKFSAEAILNEQHEVESRIGFDKVTSMDTPDEHTIVFHLKEPYVRFVEDTFFDEGIMAKHLLEASVGTGFTAAPYHRAPVGMGPFKFKEWVTGSHVTVVKNEAYFRGAPAIDEITFRFIPDTNSLLVALRAGEIDGFDNAGTDQYPQLQKMPEVVPYITPQLMWEHVDMNTEDPILKDVRVRQAIQLAIDRDQISKEVYAGLWPPAHGDVSPRVKWFNPEVEKIVRHDPVEAVKLLDAAGWKTGKDGMRERDGKRLKVAISTTAGRRQRELTEQVIQQHLAAVGIELTVENHNATAFFAPYEQDGVLKRGRFQLGMFAWISSPDPDRFTQYHSTQVPPPEGQNHPRYRNPRMDQLLTDGIRTHDQAKRKAIYDEVQMIVATDVPMTPIVWRADIDPFTTRLKNFKPNPTQTGDTWNIGEWTLASE